MQLLSIDLNRSKNPKYKELTADTTKYSLAEIVIISLFRVKNGGTIINKEKILLFVIILVDKFFLEQCAVNAITNLLLLIIFGIWH